MLSWLKRQLKWWVARDELERLFRAENTLREAEQWLAEIPEVSDVVSWLRINMNGGMCLGISDFRDRLREARVAKYDGMISVMRTQARHDVVNNPEFQDFIAAIQLEATHQRERWGSAHDDGKSAEDWMWLVAYLSTKAVQAKKYGDKTKYFHHIVTCGAALLNWHAHATGRNRDMRPGAQMPRGDA